MMDARARARETGLEVLFAVRPTLTDEPGGDSAQIQGTARALEKIGVHVTISSDPLQDLSGFDCVHLWHLERVHETYVHLRNVRRQAKPFVLSPIYWPREGRALRPGLRGWRRVALENMKNLFRCARAAFPQERGAALLALRSGWGRARRALLEEAGAVLPNSRAEEAILRQEADRPLPCVVVPNGVDADLLLAARSELGGRPRDGLVCVGHFDPRKNQAELIRAVRGLGLPLTLVGGPRRMHRRYHERCLRLADSSVEFKGALRGPEVLEILASARLHVCSSRFETPGLANLEAAAMGCGLVLPEGPPTREYFGDDATYFSRPDGPSIREAILKGIARPVPADLPERVLREFNWRRAAEATLEGYRLALASSRPEERPRADEDGRLRAAARSKSWRNSR